MLNNNDCAVLEVVRLLGLAVDRHLKWDAQCQNVCNKLSSICFAFRRLRDLVALPVLRSLYFGCCYPHLMYGISVWGGGSDLIRVFIMQKKIIRVMYRMNYNESCRGIFKMNKMLTIYGIYIFQLVNFLITHEDLFSDNVFRHQYVTRIRSDYCYPKHRLSKSENSLAYKSLKCYNKLPNYIKIVNTPSLFRKKLHTLLCELEPYSLEEFFNAKF